jgi:[amino group carrier protein]-L-2-aminoadipate 6-kinase
MTDRPGGTVVVKCGGSADISAVCGDIAELRARGTPVAVVHGGSAAMTSLAGQLGVELRQLIARDGVVTRYTDKATLDVLLLALAGRVKPALLTQLARDGVRAIGLTGIDAGLLRARRKDAVRTIVDGRVTVVRGNLSGRIVAVDALLLRMLIKQGLVPVVSPPALDEDGEPVNVNADRVAASVAVALGADSLVFVTGAPGILADPADPASVLARFHVPASSATRGGISGGMGIKLVAAEEALAGGVARVYVCGAAGRPVSRALSHQGGTSVRRA